jgi:polysaccharide biosynthesis protein PslH
MPPLLYLTHRIPFPPNKGDKIRSYHLLKALARDYRVYLGTAIDDIDDWRHLDALREHCAEVFAIGVRPRLARFASLRGLATGEALTVPYYRSRRMARWVRATLERHAIEKAVVFSAAMAQYVIDRPRLATLVDLVDVDSAKWRQYAPRARWPMSWVYAREAERLLEFERSIAARSVAVTLVSAAETALFLEHAPEAEGKAFTVRNGVDAEFFAPDPARASPYSAEAAPIVFTGAMDYWPNVDAVTWFARQVLPAVRARVPAAVFTIVGMNPAPAVRALAELPGVAVTGRVEDVRPYLQHARAVVAPLRIARGVQNKILEAMALEKTVVATSACLEGLGVRAGTEILAADDAGGFATAVGDVLAGATDAAIGRAARAHVVAEYGWARNLARIDQLLSGRGEVPAAAPTVADERAFA